MIEYTQEIESKFLISCTYKHLVSILSQELGYEGTVGDCIDYYWSTPGTESDFLRLRLDSRGISNLTSKSGGAQITTRTELELKLQESQEYILKFLRFVQGPEVGYVRKNYVLLHPDPINQPRICISCEEVYESQAGIRSDVILEIETESNTQLPFYSMYVLDVLAKYKVKYRKVDWSIYRRYIYSQTRRRRSTT